MINNGRSMCFSSNALYCRKNGGVERERGRQMNEKRKIPTKRTQRKQSAHWISSKMEWTGEPCSFRALSTKISRNGKLAGCVVPCLVHVLLCFALQCDVFGLHVIAHSERNKMHGAMGEKKVCVCVCFVFGARKMAGRICAPNNKRRICLPHSMIW